MRKTVKHLVIGCGYRGNYQQREVAFLTRALLVGHHSAMNQSEFAWKNPFQQDPRMKEKVLLKRGKKNHLCTSSDVGPESCKGPVLPQADDSDGEVQETRSNTPPVLRRSTRERRAGQRFTHPSLGQPTYHQLFTFILTLRATRTHQPVHIGPYTSAQPHISQSSIPFIATKKLTMLVSRI